MSENVSAQSGVTAERKREPGVAEPIRAERAESDRGGLRRKCGIGKVVGVLGFIIGAFGIGALLMLNMPETREEASPKSGDTKTMTLPGGVKMEMVYVASGSFMMGSPTNEAGPFMAREEMQHRVKLTKGYWIGKYPVTQSQWKALVSANGVSFSEGEPVPYFSTAGGGQDRVAGLDTSDFPMENMSWDDCDTLVKALNRNEGDGRTWSMPTEAQWEFAARGGNKSRGYTYSGGNDLDAIGWYYENSGVRRVSDSDWNDFNLIHEKMISNKCRPHSVKEKDVGNELGIVGMSGNVYEWCQDRFDEDYYSKSPVDDPCNTESGDKRALRGGDWGGVARHCRSANRSGYDPALRNLFGLRLCCSAGPRE